MPQIPIQRQALDLNVPMEQYNVAQAGLVGASIEQFGQTLAKESEELFTTLKKDEAASDSMLKEQETRNRALEKNKELQLNSRGGYVTDANGNIPEEASQRKTVTQAYDEWAAEEYKTQQLASPSTLASKMFAANAGNLLQDVRAKVSNYQLESMATESQRRLDAMLINSQRSQTVSPSLQYAYDDYNRASAYIESARGKTISNPTADKWSLKAESDIADHVMSGMHLNLTYTKNLTSGRVQEEASKALQVLYGVDSMSKDRKQRGLKTVSTMLTPDQVAKWRGVFTGLLKDGKELDKAALNSEVSSLSEWARTEKNERAVKEAYLQVIPKIDKAYKDNPYGAADLKVKLMEGIAKRPLSSPEFTFSSDAEYEKYKKSVPEKTKKLVESITTSDLKTTPGLGAAGISKLSSETLSEINRIQAERDKDFAKYAFTNDEELKQKTMALDFNDPLNLSKNVDILASRTEKMKKLFAKAKGGKIDNYRAGLSLEESQKLANTIKNAEGLKPQEGAAGVAKLILTMRRDKSFPEYINQMINDNNLSPEYRIVALQDTQAGVEDTLLLMGKGKEEINKNFGDLISTNPQLKSSFDATRPSELTESVRAAYTGIRGSSVITQQEVTAMVGLVEMKAKQEMLKGETQPNKAWENAVGALFTRHVKKVKFDNGGITFIPKSMEGPDEEAFKAASNYFLTEDGVKQLGLDVPKTKDGKPISEFLVPGAFEKYAAGTAKFEISPTRLSNGEMAVRMPYDPSKAIVLKSTKRVNEFLKSGKPFFMPLSKFLEIGRQRLLEKNTPPQQAPGAQESTTKVGRKPQSVMMFGSPDDFFGYR